MGNKKQYPSQEEVESFVRQNFLGKNDTKKLPGCENIWIAHESASPASEFYEVNTVPVDGRRYVLLKKVKGFNPQVVK